MAFGGRCYVNEKIRLLATMLNGDIWLKDGDVEVLDELVKDQLCSPYGLAECGNVAEVDITPLGRRMLASVTTFHEVLCWMRAFDYKIKAADGTTFNEAEATILFDAWQKVKP